MAKGKAIKKLAEKLKAKKKKETVLSKKTQARNKAAVPKMVKDALKKEVRKMRKAERRKLIKQAVDDIFSGKQSKLNPYTTPIKKGIDRATKHSGGVVRKQAGGFVQRRNQRRQG